MISLRVHKALDGDLQIHALTPAERAELARVQSSIAAVLRAIPVVPVPDLSDVVLERIQEATV